MKGKIKPLNEKSLLRAVGSLAKLDSDLAKIAADFGPPPLWARHQGFQTLVHIILEQQVSLSSAKAAFNKLLSAATPLTPDRFLQLGDGELKAIGFSRQKTLYGRCLARAISQGDIDITALNSMDDESVRSELMKIKGIGRWTSDIYLLMALLRPDVWPRGDLALALAVQQVKRLKQRPTEEELSEISSQWQPWRSVAARLLWHNYLSRRHITKALKREDEMRHTIRPATPSDSSAINELCVEAYQEFEISIGSANWQQLRDALSHASDLSSVGELIVAEDATHLLGVVLYVPPGKSDGVNIPSPWASIRMLAVSVSGRGKGIGRALAEECVDRARRDGAEAIGLTTGEMMKIAQAMYERMGFKKEAELGTRFGVKHARYVLILKQSV